MTNLSQMECTICHRPMGWLDNSWKEEIDNHVYCNNCVEVKLK